MLFQHQLAFAKGYLKHGAEKGLWKWDDFKDLPDDEQIDLAEKMYAWEEKHTRRWDDSEPMATFHLNRKKYYGDLPKLQNEKPIKRTNV